MASLMGEQLGGTAARSFTRVRSYPVALWASVGILLFIFELSVWLAWVAGPHFTPTDPGPDPISSGQLQLLYAVQMLVTVLAAVAAWFWIVRPWIRNGYLTTDGMLAICCWSLVFYDVTMNYTSPTVLYNSHLVNMGAWTLGSWPGWTSPNGQLLPEPLLVTVPGYLCLVFVQVLVVCWLLRKVKTRFPGMGIFSTIGLIVLGMTIADSLIEVFLLRTGLYAYPGGIREVTLFAGQTYQFPLTEGLTFGGLGVGAIAVLRYFRDDKGLTFAEQGLEQLRFSGFSKQWVRFLALFGFTHLAFIVLFTIPNQWLATHSDPFPEGYPSYLINNMCVYGPAQNLCPGPGVMMPRPENNPF